MKAYTLVGMFGAVSVLAACAATHPAPVASSAPPPPAAAAAPSQTASAPSKPADPAAAESLTVDFANDSVGLSESAKAQMDHAARLYRDAQPEVMIITGHTDKSGPEFGNVILSAKRAQVVKQALADRGIPADRLQIVADGEAEPVVGVLPSRTAVVTWR